MESCANIQISGIPCFDIQPAHSLNSKGTILLYHGWASTIGSYLFFATLVSSWGYRVVVPELPHHGDRGVLEYSDRSVLQRYFWEVVLQGGQEAATIAGELSKTGELLGIIGHSSGGFIAAGALAQHSRMRAAAVINGSCAWVRFEELYREKDGRAPMSSEERLKLEKHDPLASLDFRENKALLLLHGKEDTIIPIDSQRHFMDKRLPTASPDNLKMVEYPGVNHQITLGMLQQAKEWLDRHLASSKA